MHLLFRHRILCACMILFFQYIISGEALCEKPADYVPISGTVLFSFGDNSAWHSPAYNDRLWGLQSSVKRWPDSFLKARSTGWYRIHFSLPVSSAWTDPAILLGRISGADEVYLNGVKIGGEGVIGDKVVSAAKVERLYRIPSELIRPGKDNILAVRVMSMYPDREDFAEGIRIGNYITLLIEKLNLESRQTSIETVIFVILILNIMVLIMNVISGTLPYRMCFFGIFMFLYLVVYTIDSLLFCTTSWKTPFTQQLYFACIGLIPATILLLQNNPLTLFTKIFTTVAVMSSLLILFLFSGHYLSLLPYAWLFGVAVSGAWVLNISVQNFVEKKYEAGIILMSNCCIALSGILFASKALFHFHPFRLYEEFLWILGGPVFMYLQIYAMIKLFARIRRDQIELTEKVLITQEQERERLARELHDGIGQSLQAIKLNLDMMEASIENCGAIKQETILEFREAIGITINDVRNISTSLRPSSFNRLDLSETIVDDGKRLEQTSGIRIAVSAADIGELPSQTKYNAYRIYREGMMNILKHASATMVHVNLTMRNEALVIEIIDNGKGFDAARIQESSKGLGLSIMRERAVLLGGALEIRTAPGMGTSVIVEVPLQ